MNVAKNWALTIMLIALAFAHFSSELLLKEQMIIPVKKKLNSAGHIDATLIDFSEICQKNPAKSAVFYWLFLGEVSPQNLLWNRPIFLRICPWKSFEFWLFSAKIQRNRLIFPWILTFFLQKSHEIGWFFRKFAPENPAKFCLFSAKYQKPWFLQAYTVYLSFPQKKIKPRGSMHVSLCYPCT